jgi:hypothetical protein
VSPIRTRSDGRERSLLPGKSEGFTHCPHCDGAQAGRGKPQLIPRAEHAEPSYKLGKVRLFCGADTVLACPAIVGS